jgi:alkylhydroperoxidase family enzyme
VTGCPTAHAVKNALSHPADDAFAVARYTIQAGTGDDEVRAVLAGAGAPLTWRGERLRTWGYRQVRRGRRFAREHLGECQREHLMAVSR